ncbi:sulfhydryl oxidase 1-like [Toxorhynchites rutilus septentrionalis]|uniref:sulfhydryl oxidase 1-like n=1 Tax=Toxorhynchites rutilus septentrionalis TaxID=329112 RepID=UPI0024796A19|nr:sulfhydryl oxidase 1-like [Toxorhynchites rutilus septentrionalis]
MSRFKILLAVGGALLLLPSTEIHGANIRSGGEPSLYEQHLFKRQAAKQNDGQQTSGLYDENDSVISLTAGNLKERVFQQPHASLVEFYNSYCGFCRRYAPIWKQLASDILGWQKLVKVTALDCSQDENNAICREFEVMAYPTIRFFAPYYEDGAQKIGDAITAHAETEVINALIGHMHNVTQKPPGWPDFTPMIDNASKSELFATTESRTVPPKYAYIINENETNGTTVGSQIILDFIDTPSAVIKRTKDLTQPSGLRAIIRETMSEVPLPVDEFNREKLAAAIRRHLNEHHISVTEVSTKSTNKESSTDQNISEIMERKQEEALRAKVKELGPAVIYQADLEEALKFALYHEVTRFKKIDGERLLALQRFLNVLVRYFPFNENGIKFLKEVRQFVLNSEEGIDGDDFASNVKQIELNRASIFASNRWMGCASSKDGLRRYPCGLWTLFHYLTVQAAESEMSTDPLEVLQAMHGFIKYFFGCSDCSNHFQQMASRNKIWNVTSKDDAVLWLWASHNEVNRRLAGDATEDPEHPKIQFPPAEVCPLCRKTLLTNHHNHQQYTLDGGNEWDLLQVLAFLKNMYNFANRSPVGLQDDGILPQKMAYSGTGENFQTNRIFGNVLNEMDIRMGALLYVACIVMLLIAVKMVVKRGYRKKMYAHDILGKV